MRALEEAMGKVFVEIKNDNNEVLTFTCDDGKKFYMFHDQDCCEVVTIEDICGDLRDLIGSPILMAEEEYSSENPPDGFDPEFGSFTWSFYKFATIKGYVTIRWYGESNGYYSESAEFSDSLGWRHR